MKRYVVGDDGELRARDGERLPLTTRELRDVDGGVVGVVHSITLLPPAGGRGVGSSSVELPTTTENNDVRTKGRGRARARGELDANIEQVWSEYVAVHSPRRKELDAEARKIIREALKVASAAECCGAIRGNKASGFHQGDNPRRKKYNRLSQILKGKRGFRTTREQIDLFLDIAAKSGLQSSNTSVDPATLRQAKQDVIDAWTYPGDEQVVKRGEESAAWLAQHGWTIERDGEANRLGQPKPRFGVAE